MPPPLVLASASRYRRELLERLGVPFRALPAQCDEDALKDPSLSPGDLAALLALAKAESLRWQEPESVIIGSDQVAALGDQILHKPGTTSVAEEQLALLSGREHALHTAIAVVHPGGTLRHLDVTHLTMRPLNRQAIARYVAHDQPLDCAGSYRLESRGVALFSSITSADHTAIIGMPLMALASMLASLGYEIP